MGREKVLRKVGCEHGDYKDVEICEVWDEVQVGS